MRFFNLLISFVVFLVAAELPAQTLCRGKVSYKWQRGEPAPAAATPAAGGETAAGSGGASASTEVVVALLEVSAEDEPKAKAEYSKQGARELARAEQSCRSQHENFSGCLSTRFEAKAAVLSGLSFSARKSLEDAIGKDCETQRGVCLGANLSDPQCENKAPPTPSAAPDEGKGKKKK